MADIGLRVNGKEYAGWKSARVTQSIESVAGSFDLEVSDRTPARTQVRAIREEDECTLVLGEAKTVLITGYVDKRRLSYDAESHSLSVSGRDKTGDLVDCSALLQKWEWKNTSILTLAKQIAEPYGIAVTLQPGIVLGANPQKLSADPGDSAFEVIESACRKAGLLPVSDGRGGLVLTRAGSSRCTTELVEGQNILSASADYDCSGRFRDYVVLGQHRGTDNNNGLAASALKGFAQDENVRRAARTLVIRPEGNVTNEQANKRAQWEATVRASRGDVVTVTVQGWTQGDGTLWPVNALVKVKSPLIGVDGTMLIASVTYSVDERGTTTTLTMKGPDSYKPEVVITKAKSTDFWKEVVKGV